MKKNSRGKTIYLPHEVGEKIKSLTKLYRSKECRINESNLVTEIVIDHLSRQDGRFTSRIEEKYFDEKKFLRNLIASNSNDTDLAGALKKIKNINSIKTVRNSNNEK